jgi:hypothetical protein
MSIRLRKDFIPLTVEAAAALPAQMGIYEIADSEGRTLCFGYAGGRSRFGLRGEIEAQCANRRGQSAQFRYEVHMQYLTRYRELLMVYRADHGDMPPENLAPENLGRLRPDPIA